MRYHNISKEDMLNGEGLRVVLWVAGCEHHCKGCQNPQTWNPEDGLEFDDVAYEEILDELSKPHVSGITLSGGDPFHPDNIHDVFSLVRSVYYSFPNKTIWIYTGYTWDEIKENHFMYEIMDFIDVLVEGEFIEKLKDNNYKWAGSTNQRVIDVQKTLGKGQVVLYECN